MCNAALFSGVVQIPWAFPSSLARERPGCGQLETAVEDGRSVKVARLQKVTWPSPCVEAISQSAPNGIPMRQILPSFTKHDAIPHAPLTVDPAPSETVYVNRFPKPIT